MNLKRKLNVDSLREIKITKLSFTIGPKKQKAQIS